MDYIDEHARRAAIRAAQDAEVRAGRALKATAPRDTDEEMSAMRMRLDELQRSRLAGESEIARLKELHLAEQRKAVAGWKELERTLDQERADLAVELRRLRDRAFEQARRIQEAGEAVESAKIARRESEERMKKALELESGIAARVEEAVRQERAELARRTQEAVQAVEAAKNSIRDSEERMKNSPDLDQEIRARVEEALRLRGAKRDPVPAPSEADADRGPALMKRELEEIGVRLTAALRAEIEIVESRWRDRQK